MSTRSTAHAPRRASRTAAPPRRSTWAPPAREAPTEAPRRTSRPVAPPQRTARPATPPRRRVPGHRAAAPSTNRGRQLLIRVVVFLTAVLGVNYVVWRWLASVNWDSWWIAVPLVLAETFSLVDSLLFGLGAWRLRERGTAPPPDPDATVDVLVTTYDEPLDLVMRTARAAQRIRGSHQTWILDDGARPALRALAEAEGIGVVTRSSAWTADVPRHAKAGNLNNALMVTEGEFLLILDADQVPEPEILERTLGWFRDDDVALVQTPQWFVNTSDSDPLGSQAPLFYGPIQQSKDGWNAAFFCGSNAILRREALMQLGVSRYVSDVTVAVHRAVRSSRRILDRALAAHRDEPRAVRALEEVSAALDELRAAVAAGDALADVTWAFQRRVDAVRRALSDEDIASLRADLAELAAMAGEPEALASDDAAVDAAVEALGHADWSPLGAIESVSMLVAAFDVGREDEAQAIMPLATISVTEDMATSMRLHGLGWRSVYHDEVLAKGLAPEDLPTMLTQRLRWAQGTMQVLFRENPLLQRGLSWGQRLMYFSTMWSYLSGFAAVVYVAAPVLYLCFGVLPVTAFSVDFFARLVPFLLLNQLLFLVVAAGRPTWRGQQYSLALFPIWIRSVTTAFQNVYRGRSLGFAVTPKTRTEAHVRRWDLVRPQLFVMAALVVSLAVVGVRYAAGQAEGIAPLVNVAWVLFDLAVFSIVIRAVSYSGPPEQDDGTASQGPGTPGQGRETA
ncbi:cellulose synthase (UDP-forming) [Frigoribacterium sp. PhB160]|uniref:glycosyltransferase family 2 protein n=1 Tax=Frigoribacterium sp. PhB160 TaxID=2485192 RepID=UPI000F9243A9|nr:glycosyltransferase family 2 protein [Frigoribacterium sp. PhB160]ROS58160.1 cellulose synthase (UDP-forming) [Frigoribacterium sp. PhB160]